MEHTLEQHKNKLDQLCRLFGNRSLTILEKKKRTERNFSLCGLYCRHFAGVQHFRAKEL